LGVGNSKQLYFLTSPPNATYPSMSWSSSNTAVATVSDLGVVTGVAPGKTVITLTLGSITSDPVAVTVDPCGSPFTAPSGKVYNTAAYNNANLTNLCWTTSDLQEIGYSATCYMNDCDTYPTRGYYYTSGRSANIACSSLHEGKEYTWRVPTSTEWAQFRNAFLYLTAGIGTHDATTTLQGAWNGADYAMGSRDDSGVWSGWGDEMGWWAYGAPDLCLWTKPNEVNLRYRGNTMPGVYIAVRCVRDL
jgi:hypothetical protein